MVLSDYSCKLIIIPEISSTCAYAELYNLLLRFYEIDGAKIAGKVTKCQRESCIILLQSETCVTYSSYAFCTWCMNTKELGKQVGI